MDATAHLDASAVDDGMTLTDIDPDKVYGFRANILSGAELKSVKLELRGPGADDIVTRTENYQPYSTATATARNTAPRWRRSTPPARAGSPPSWT